MAKDTITRLTDDLDGTSDESVTTVQIGWNGEWRELELSERNQTALGKGFDKFWNAGRPVNKGTSYQERRGGRGTTKATNGTKRSSGARDYDRSEFKSWAAANNVKLSRGRPPRQLVDRFLASQS